MKAGRIAPYRGAEFAKQFRVSRGDPKETSDSTAHPVVDCDERSKSMRTFLMTVFWVTNIGSVIQLLVMAIAGWVVFSGAYPFFDLNVDVFITHYAPWFLWLKALIVGLLGEFGHWVLSIPILVIAPLKLVAGTIIGLWAYSVAKNMPGGPSSTQYLSP